MQLYVEETTKHRVKANIYPYTVMREFYLLTKILHRKKKVFCGKMLISNKFVCIEHGMSFI